MSTGSMATTESPESRYMPKEELMKRYPHTTWEILQDLQGADATNVQFERSDANCKIEIDNRLKSYILGNEEVIPHPYTHVVVIGISGSGKSATGNTLLEKKVFREAGSATSVTTSVKVEEHLGSRPLSVTDTPGSWHVINKNQYDYIYAIVINLESPRFGVNELRDVRKLKDYNNVVESKRCFVLLTHARDALRGQSLTDYMKEIRGDPLHDLLSKDMEKERVMAINNTYSTEYESKKQREMISNIIGKTSRVADFEPPQCFLFGCC